MHILHCFLVNQYQYLAQSNIEGVSAERGGFSRLSEAPTPLLLAVVEPPENTLFSFQKEIRRGK